jgi:hypothetical protein
MPLPAYALDDQALLAQCAVEKFRAQGPGGQHVNRTDSAVRITHRESGLAAQCQDHREQQRNLAEAARRLRIRLACLLRGQSQLVWLEKFQHGSRLSLSGSSADYALAAAVCLDALAQKAGSMSDAAKQTGLSTSQLAKALTLDQDVRRAADALRAEHGLSPIR